MTSQISTLEELRAGGKRAMAVALTAVEQSKDEPWISQLLDEAYISAKAFVTGFTGPPGVGKSTLINSLIKLWRDEGQSVGVIAVDPSSRKTGGALLGDRTRMITDPEDEAIFVRSLASRGTLGGLSELTFPSAILMRAVYDQVIVETVGVGQSEADISSIADTVVLCVQPGSGDSLQFMKAGIMEIPDIAVVTKADMGASARRALADIEGALSLGEQTPAGWRVKILLVSSQKGEGLPELTGAINSHHAWLQDHNLLETSRQSQASHWLESAIFGRFGREGLSCAGRFLALAPGEGPFDLERGLSDRLSVEIKSS